MKYYYFEMGEEVYSGRVVINMSGVIYETYLTTLARFPHTLLGCSEKRKQYYDYDSKQYFFNRNRKGFEAILYYYQSEGRLSRPPDMPFDVFKDEVEFFELGSDVLEDLFRKEGYIVDSPRPMPRNAFQKKVWRCLEYPDTSKLANILTVVSLSIIVISVFFAIIVTVYNNHTINPNITLSNGTFPKQQIWFGDDQVWFNIEVILNSLFGLEYTLRLAFSPNKRDFVKAPVNIVDLLAFLPYMVVLAYGGSVHSSVVSVFHILRIIRIFRIFKISRYSRRLKVIGYCLLESLQDLGLFLVCLVIVIILASSLLHYIEGEDENSPFNSIPSTFWFIIQTISTIGYGDVIPITMLGKLATCIVAVFGVITLALPILSFVARFNTLYSQNVDL